MYRIGVEVESVGQCHRIIKKDTYWQRNYERYGFCAKSDGSLKGESYNCEYRDGETFCDLTNDHNCEEGLPSCEFTTPPLDFPGKLYRLSSLISYIADTGGEINSSCGLHIHVSDGNDWTDKTLIELEKLCITYQEALMLIGRGDFKSHRGTEYCHGLRDYPEAGKSNKRVDKGSKKRDRGDILSERDRYHLVNFQNLYSLKTIEFRFCNGTLNPLLITAYCHLAVALIERAKQQNCSKVSRQIEGWSDKKELQNQAVRLLKRLKIDPWARAILIERAKRDRA